MANAQRASPWRQVDVAKLQCDFCCGTGRKWLRGPRGTGFLYTRHASLPEGGGSRGLVGEPPLIDLCLKLMEQQAAALEMPHCARGWTTRSS